MAREFDELESEFQRRGGPPPSLNRPFSPIGKNPGEQPYRVAQAKEFALPEGASLEPPKMFQLPPGATLEPPKQPGRPGGIGSDYAAPVGPEPPTSPTLSAMRRSGTLPEDPHERAALRTSLSVQPSGIPYEGEPGRMEGKVTGALTALPGQVGRAAVAGVEAATAGAKKAIGEGERLQATGDFDPSVVLEAATIGAPTSVARGTGRAIAEMSRTPLERSAQEIGVTSLPAAAVSGETGQLSGRAVSGLPFFGGRLRRGAEASSRELQEAGSAAALRPTGAAVSQAEAGGVLRAALEPTGAFKGLLKGSDEDVVSKIATMASEVKRGANVSNLALIRHTVPTAEWPQVQAALIQRLGQSPTTAEFNPRTWISNYGNLSEAGKSIMFGPVGEGLRRHLDAIETVSRGAHRWEQFKTGRGSLGTTLGVAGVGLGLYQDPMATLAAAAPVGLIARGLSRPAIAAPMAQWSRAYERVVKSNLSPPAMAAFTLAGVNLANSLGIDPQEFVNKVRNQIGLEPAAGFVRRKYGVEGGTSGQPVE